MTGKTVNLLRIALIILLVTGLYSSCGQPSIAQKHSQASEQQSAADAWPLSTDFKEFCDTHFTEGSAVAAICEYINGKVAFVPEGESEDHWQHPEETMGLGTGDCEDAVLLFAYLARHSRVPATYCWGECNDGVQSFAHVWVELESVEHAVHVVEFFGNNTSGCIFPAATDKWERKRHLIIPHSIFCQMAKTGFKRQAYIFNSLNEVFTK